ncbi:MAG TPA: hypothetical protein VMQ11_16505 [Alphaproteobacteria bacterium]|nr:hypothetical protein [Alphaproteobacteria bacterium]
MVDDDITKLTRAWIENKPFEQAQLYARRGRRYEALPTDEVKERWVVAFKRMVGNVRDASLQRDPTDLEAELILRQEQPPFERVHEEMDAFTAAAVTALEILKQDPERFAKADQDVMREIAAFRQSATSTPKN